MFGLNPWIIVGALLTVGGAFGGGYVKGRADARSSCQSAALKIELAATKADLQAAERVNRETLRRMAEADSLRLMNMEKINALADELARRPGPACVLDDADARRLREFGGAAVD